MQWIGMVQGWQSLNMICHGLDCIGRTVMSSDVVPAYVIHTNGSGDHACKIESNLHILHSVFLHQQRQVMILPQPIKQGVSSALMQHQKHGA